MKTLKYIASYTDKDTLEFLEGLSGDIVTRYCMMTGGKNTIKEDTGITMIGELNPKFTAFSSYGDFVYESTYDSGVISRIDIYEVTGKDDDNSFLRYETCSYCNTMVKLPGKLGFLRCPNCGKWIVNCQECEKKMTDCCDNCVLKLIARERNISEGYK